MAEEIKVVAVADPAKQVHKERQREAEKSATCCKERERGGDHPCLRQCSGKGHTMAIGLEILHCYVCIIVCMYIIYVHGEILCCMYVFVCVWAGLEVQVVCMEMNYSVSDPLHCAYTACYVLVLTVWGGQSGFP